MFEKQYTENLPGSEKAACINERRLFGVNALAILREGVTPKYEKVSRGHSPEYFGASPLSDRMLLISCDSVALRSSGNYALKLPEKAAKLPDNQALVGPAMVRALRGSRAATACSLLSRLTSAVQIIATSVAERF
jgi:hypothetical protein